MEIKSLTLRLPPSTMARLSVMARQGHRSLNQQMIHLIETAPTQEEGSANDQR